MNRLSVRLDDSDFIELDKLGGKNRTENTRLAIRFAKKYKDKKDAKNRANTKHKKKKEKK